MINTALTILEDCLTSLGALGELRLFRCQLDELGSF